MIEQLESELRSALRARAGDLPAGAGARVRARDYRPRTRDLRPPVAAGALTTAAAAAAAVLLIDLGPKAPAAFAGWTPAPTHASRVQVTGARGDCTQRLAQLRGSAVQAASQRAGQNPLLQQLARLSTTAPVLTDTRGPFTFVVFNAGQANASCISGPGFASVSVQVAAHAPSPPAAGTIVPSFEVRSARAGHAYSFVEGHTGTGVTAVTLVLSDGSHLQATLQNGWLVAWWPGDAQLTSAQVATASGTSTQTFHTTLPAGCPPPPSGSTTPAGSTTRSGTTLPVPSCTIGTALAGGPGEAAGIVTMDSTTHRGG
jgi:hypothetical protein